MQTLRGLKKSLKRWSSKAYFKRTIHKKMRGAVPRIFWFFTKFFEDISQSPNFREKEEVNAAVAGLDGEENIFSGVPSS